MNASTDIELDPAVKSRPDYPPVAIDARASNQVFIAQNDQQRDLVALYEQCDVGHKTLFTQAATALPDAMATTLPNLTLSTALYVSGDEPYVWDIHKQLIALGFGAEKIHLMPPDSAARRLFCTHCYTIMEGVTHTPHVCTGCGRPLLVRDHFSRLLGAYVGLQINAEDPDDIPAPEALTTLKEAI